MCQNARLSDIHDVRFTAFSPFLKTFLLVVEHDLSGKCNLSHSKMSTWATNKITYISKVILS